MCIKDEYCTTYNHFGVTNIILGTIEYRVQACPGRAQVAHMASPIGRLMMVQ